MTIELRPYQTDLIAAAREKLTQHKSVLVQAATGAGKTALASYMVKGAIQKNKPVFFTVHRKDLIKQTSVAFNEFEIPHSFIAANKPYNPYSMAQICSIDTFKNRLGKVPVPALMIVDECHMANSEGWSKVINYYRQQGTYIIGLSATPWRLDGSGLGKHFESMVTGPAMSWLIENRYLSDYRLFAPSIPDLDGVKITAGDFNRGDLADWADGDNVRMGCAIEHYKKLAPNTRAICYCVSRRDSEKTAHAFREAGIPAMHMDGETPMEERKKIISAYANGQISVITNVDLITTGFDLAAQVGRDVAVETIILMRPTRSMSLYLQMVGRGLRPKPNPCIILDHSGCAYEHGLPDDKRVWTLDDRPRRKAGEKTISIKVCQECLRAYRAHAKKCPYCGHVPVVKYREIETVDGDLIEVAREMNKKRDKQAVGRARTIEELTQIAHERGYKIGWVWQQARLKGIRS